MFGVPASNEGCERYLAKLARDGALVATRKYADDLLLNGATAFMCSTTEAAPARTSDGD